MDDQDRQRRIASSRLGREYVAKGDPSGWFDPIYRGARAAAEPDHVPWVDQRPNRFFVEWLERENPTPGRACVVACGLGDDAEELAKRGFEVVAFDVSPTAIDWCRERWPDTRVDYRVADLYDPPREWLRVFDLVVDVYTVQSFPLTMRGEAREAVAAFTATGGRLVAVAHGRDDDVTDPMGPPWPLSTSEMRAFESLGFATESHEDIPDPDEQGVMRMRGVFRRS